MKRFLRGIVVQLALSALFLAGLTGCVSVPETGRSQLNIIPAAQEMQLGLTGFEQLKKETPINRNPALNAMIQKVGRRIAGVANLPGAQWEFVVFESKEANAFACPEARWVSIPASCRSPGMKPVWPRLSAMRWPTRWPVMGLSA